MTKQEHYLHLWKSADEILKQPNNPCDIQKIGDDITCRASRTGFGQHNTLCCTGCEHHHKEVGCTVKALWCKLGWCYGGKSYIEGMEFEDSPMFAELAKLRAEAIALRVPLLCRASFEQTFKGE